ncbi:isoleucine--tRNA ligase [Balamuthia mandrillaris]
MEPVPESISFPKTEETVLELWERIDAFQTSLKRSEGKPEYSFYDGPPFATGLPHYGHILAGTIKDTVTRYAHQTGHHVTRRFGWDTHGLPIEFEIDKELGIKTRDDVLAIGIEAYNKACRGIVMRYSSEWEKIVSRLGRWIDFKNDYKTLDPTFMESVWWVFKELYDRKLVYRGFKVMPYSTACTTPLSNFEANMNYKEVDDPAVIVSFPLKDDPEVKLIAWTTTPWTLPSNLALCVNPELDYVKLKDAETGNIYILCEARLSALYPEKKGKKGKAEETRYTILEKFKGATLKGKKYEPLFSYFAQEEEKGAFSVLVDGYVTSESGTGIVHCAPAFGEDDYRVCFEAGVIRKGEGLPCPVDANGRFTADVPDFQGRYVKDADKDILVALKGRKRVVHSGRITHSYPFCWRSETPLIYKAVPSFFIAVEKIKDRLLANNEQTYWVPSWVKEKRFHHWLVDARDWAVSRNRFWGTPIPLWMNEQNPDEMVCIGSIEELEKLSGVKVTDLHRESIDHITIPSPSGNGVLRRVDEVFDCWFESGSMPYAQIHYPFENKELFQQSFPADFIAEGIDQTRGWFYTLLVLSTALFDKPPFKNLIVNGLVLASDGKKMSKRLKNYPDPVLVVQKHGADALRLYLINSPVVRGEELRFEEKGVKDVVREVFLPWFNAYRFCEHSIRLLEMNGEKFQVDTTVCLKSPNVMDKWILAATQSLLAFVKQEMAAYRLYTVVPKLVNFIGQLTNWYIRFNRKRLKGHEGKEEANFAINTLYEVIYTLSVAMAPFTPFFTEYVYQNLRNLLPEEKREDCVHYLMFPDPKEELLNKEIEEAVGHMQNVIELGRLARDRRKLPIKHPLKEVTVVSPNQKLLDNLESLKPYILAELNLKNVVLTSDEGSYVVTRAEPDKDRLGKRLRKQFGPVSKALQALQHEQINQLRKDEKMEIEGCEILLDDVKIIREFKGDSQKYEAAWSDEALVVLDLEIDEKMRQEGLAREVVNRVQRLRKKAGLNVGDPVETFYEVPNDGENCEILNRAIDAQQEYLSNALQLPLLPSSFKPPHHLEVISSKEEISDIKVTFFITRLTLSLDVAAVKSKYGVDDAYCGSLQQLLAVKLYNNLKEQLLKDGHVTLTLDGKEVALALGKEVFLCAADTTTRTNAN